MEKIETKRQVFCKVTGQVQGVMYRSFAQGEATKLNLRGTVRNLDDGSVEVCAQGNEDNLKTFLDKLKIGSSSSRVAKVDVLWEDVKESYNNFRVL